MKTAKTDPFLAKAKRDWNAKIYTQALRLARTEGREEAATFLATFLRTDLRAAFIAKAMAMPGDLGPDARYR